jgi:ribosome biogenesis GTPase
MAPRRPRPERRVVESIAASPSTPPPGALPAVIVRAHGKFFEAQLADGRVLLATVRGLLKREKRRTDLVAVGDRVWVTDVGEGEGQIEQVEPRTRVLSRLARHTEDTEQVILANPDQALFLFSVREPEPHRRMLDRFLVLAESRGLPARIGVSKIDLDETDGAGGSLARRIFGEYERVYPVHYLSARTEEGLPGLAAALRGTITAVAGPSGVGKSSLLNVLDPAGRREIGEVSGATGKGRHTTTATVLRRLPGDPPTFVADTPGIRALSLQAVAAEDLDGLFPEFRPHLGRCFYPDCTHLHEPGCAVLEALAEESIARARYDSYVSLRRSDPAE